MTSKPKVRWIVTDQERTYECPIDYATREAAVLKAAHLKKVTGKEYRVMKVTTWA